jgi:hypothetical protein
MVLTLGSPRLAAARLVLWTPRIVVWLVLLAILYSVGWSYFSNPKDGPYGTCYESRGRPMPCELLDKKKQP